MAYFPMFVELNNALCLVVGGGTVAYRKVKTLRDFGAKVMVVAPKICAELIELAAGDDLVTIVSESYESFWKRNCRCMEGDSLKESNARKDSSEDSLKANDAEQNESNVNTSWGEYIRLVVAATDDHNTNHRVAEWCKKRQIPVNAVDQKEDCNFIFPSYVKEGNLVGAVSSGGNSPMLTQVLRDYLAEKLTPEMGELNEYLGKVRDSIISSDISAQEKKAAFDAIYTKWLMEKNERK